MNTTDDKLDYPTFTPSAYAFQFPVASAIRAAIQTVADIDEKLAEAESALLSCKAGIQTEAAGEGKNDVERKALAAERIADDPTCRACESDIRLWTKAKSYALADVEALKIEARLETATATAGAVQ